MGASVSASPGYWLNVRKSTTPDVKNDPTFDPQYGFEGERKQRVMIATEEELISAKVPLVLRDYCAHLFINYQACKKDKFPFIYRCHHARHEYESCQYEDYILRMKEYERERRLLERKERVELKEEARKRKEKRRAAALEGEEEDC